ncbi:hypothetical protein [Aliamphritea spongicola]|nr:hypothetical protein [Aliamphritea spongicola]
MDDKGSCNKYYTANTILLSGQLENGIELQVANVKMSAEEQYIITDELLEEIREQFKLWATFLNTGVGLLSFTLAIACLGTGSPGINASISMLVIVLVRSQGKSYFPSKVQDLRQRAKEDKKQRSYLKG